MRATVKKKDVVDLIRYHSEENDVAFRNQAYQIAKDFDCSGDTQIAAYIMALLSGANTLVPQSLDYQTQSTFLRHAPVVRMSLPLPEPVGNDIQGILNAISRNIGIHRFLFYGPAGTGKTESVKQLSAILSRELFVVEFNTVIDSRLGQTAKNIASLFDDIASFAHPERVVVLFDEIDSLALDRIDSRDVREMGRATSALLQQMDMLPEQVLLFATTNLYEKFDRAFIRRFDATVDFGRYSREDLIETAENILDGYVKHYKFVQRNNHVFHKILVNAKRIPFPGEMNNIIRSAIAFSSPGNEYDYLRRLYIELIDDGEDAINDIRIMHQQKFTIREISILTGMSRSGISRAIKELKDEQ